MSFWKGGYSTSCLYGTSDKNLTSPNFKKGQMGLSHFYQKCQNNKMWDSCRMRGGGRECKAIPELGKMWTCEEWERRF